MTRPGPLSAAASCGLLSRPLPMAAAAALLLLLLACGPVAPVAGSDVRLRGGSSLVSQAATCAPGPAEAAAQAAALFAAALNGTGESERAEYVQAYLCPDGVSLCDPLSVLEGFATIEANNSHLLVAPAGGGMGGMGNTSSNSNSSSSSSSPSSTPTEPITLQSMDLTLVQNNTLHFMGPGEVALDRSTVSLGSNNWLLLTNGTSLALNGSRLNFSSYFALSAQDSSLSLSESIAELSDTALFANNSAISLTNSTWYAHSAGAPAPPLYEGKVAGPVTWLDNTSLAATGSLLVFTDVPLVLLTRGSSLLLVNSTLQLFNSSMELWGSPLGLLNSRIQLDEGSSFGVSEAAGGQRRQGGRGAGGARAAGRQLAVEVVLVEVMEEEEEEVLFCNSTVVGEGVVAAASYGNATTTNTTGGAPPPTAPAPGSQLGVADSALAAQEYADLYLTP
ncbi:hypothetical protein HYH02_013502 [Chlamydomonas schloesseri]|uniref:Ice-binding protein n=1 Tax=Chlamydomonas schloesseri TaxID=2026947 RepID=A0A835SZA3_9CHLO|nr:hypothetical protein HYH02_013502 [Chlamydomonas schloesseri]|eukprot:KAG2430969.1 hypothetical protein HYH02_013502 [Chlamydomonas schloesseri]